MGDKRKLMPAELSRGMKQKLALAGALMGPISAVEVGMGEAILIPALVVIVIGVIATIALGVFPGPLLELAEQSSIFITR